MSKFEVRSCEMSQAQPLKKETIQAVVDEVHLECKRAEEFIVLRQSVMEGSQSFHSQHTQVTFTKLAIHFYVYCMYTYMYVRM